MCACPPVVVGWQVGMLVEGDEEEEEMKEAIEPMLEDMGVHQRCPFLPRDLPALCRDRHPKHGVRRAHVAAKQTRCPAAAAACLRLFLPGEGD